MEVDEQPVKTKTKKKIARPKVPKEPTTKASKKRKVDETTSSSLIVGENVEPEQKKAKHDQWQKYVKHKTVVVAEKKKKADNATTTTTANKKAGGTATTETTNQKKKKKTDPLEKHREPCDLMLNEKRVQELASHIEIIENINEDNCEQKALAIHVMPSRERQRAETLALGEDKAAHIVYNDVDYCMEIKRRNYERSMAAAENSKKPYSLHALMGKEGFFAIDTSNNSTDNNEYVNQILSVIIKDNRRDINFAKHSLAEAAQASTTMSASSPNAPPMTLAQRRSKLKGGKAGYGGGEIIQSGDNSANKKLNYISGGVFHSFGYNRRTPQPQWKKIVSQDEIDRAERFRKFYEHDQLEKETNFGEIAENFKMLRDLKRQHLEKFQRRYEALELNASLTPKTDIELVCMEYIKVFRHPPSAGDVLCSQGEACLFNTFSRDKNVSYIGKAFYTENERQRAIKNGTNGFSCNVHRLCVDCLIYKWTNEWDQNIQREIVPERPINYFSVMCGTGQYDSKRMLSITENDKPTGIMGHVPRYSRNNRHYKTLVRDIKRDGKYHKISVPMLDETNMDF